MKISVIIPVYNAAVFVEKAVKSAHHFDCVDEIILVEDGSIDDSLVVCKEIIDKYPKTKLFTHNNNENKGAGATRNFGILKARNEWISFLDADDFFLDNRFDKEKELNKKGKIFDGLYGALGIHYHSEEIKKTIRNKYGNAYELTTVSEQIKPKELKYVLLEMHSKINGYFHLDTFTVRKELLVAVGLFNTKLKLHQDTDILIKLACEGNLVSGEIRKPIALRGVHEGNRITNNKNIKQTRFLFYKELYFWMKDNHKEEKIHFHLFNNYKYYEYIADDRSKNIFSVLKHTLKNLSILFNDKPFFDKLVNYSKLPNFAKRIIRGLKRKIMHLFFIKQLKKYNTDYPEQ